MILRASKRGFQSELKQTRAKMVTRTGDLNMEIGHNRSGTLKT